MKTTQTDPIIDELRAVRDEHSARCGYDVEAIFRDIRAREEASGREYVSRPARRARGWGTPTVGMGDEATYSHYMIGVFDVLGQSRRLDEQTVIPLRDDPEERRRVLDNLKDTAGVVLGFRQMFRAFFEGVARSAGRAESLPEPQRSEMRAAMASNILLWGVSDAIFVAVPLAWDRHPAARVFDVYRSLLAAGSVWLAALSTNHPIRGGMEIGTGIDIEPGEIYGQGLAAAYRLESRVAGCPRIVVGPTCVNFLDAVKRSEDTSDVGSRMAASVADLCLAMLREDTDGHTVVDGLGQTMLEQSREVPDFREQFPRAYENVRTQHRHFRATGNAKLAARYKALRAYFDEHASRWCTTPTKDANASSRSVTELADSKSVTPRKQLQREFWSALMQRLDERKSAIRSKKPQPQSWMQFSIGRAGFCLEARLHSSEKWIAVHLVMQGPNAAAHYALLERQRAEIDRDLGEDLEWRPSHKKEQHVRLRRTDADSTQRENWPDQLIWMVSALEAFDKTFRQRLKSLDASDWQAVDGGADG